MRKYLIIFVFLALAVCSVVVSLIWWNTAISAPGQNSEEVRFVINKGASADTIGANLEKAGLIRDSFAFKIYLQTNDLVAKIPPGQFKIPKNLSLPELVALLQKGPTELWVTIPEGRRREELPDIFAKAFELGAAEAETFRDEFLDATENLEGFLFPDTYLFPPEISAAQVVTRLKNTFDQKFAPTPAELTAVGLTLDETVILASIIERETLTAAERPEVAGIYFNRLEADWPLQADATVQYVLGTTRCRGQIDCDWWDKPTNLDIDNTESPFNTYKYPGLPPAPIASPGLTSLNAVVNPTENDYWFYIHDAEGTIHYGKTLEEHNNNVNQYLK